MFATFLFNGNLSSSADNLSIPLGCKSQVVCTIVSNIFTELLTVNDLPRALWLLI